MTRKKPPGDELKASEKERFEQIKRVDTFLGEAPGSTTSRELQGNVVPDASLPASLKTISFNTPPIPMKAPDVFPPAPLLEVSTVTQSSLSLPDFPAQKFAAVQPGITPLPKPLSPDVLPVSVLSCYPYPSTHLPKPTAKLVLPDNLTFQKSTVQTGVPVLEPLPSPEVPTPHPNQLSPTNPSPAFPPTPQPKPSIIKSTLLAHRQIIPLRWFVSPSLSSLTLRWLTLYGI